MLQCKAIKVKLPGSQRENYLIPRNVNLM